MEALQFYVSGSDSDSESEREKISPRAQEFKNLQPLQANQVLSSLTGPSLLPPLPAEFLNAFPDPVSKRGVADDHGGRKRSFPHVEGNFALHVFIPVALSAGIQSKLKPYLQQAVTLFPSLQSMEDDDLLANPKRPQKVMKFLKEYHISLGRTVPIRIHQVDSIVPMLRRKFESQRRFWMEFGSWEVFVNDDRTRSFLSLEVVAAGTSEIQKQVCLVDDVFKLHNLPAFYKNPRPHISLAWALGDVTESLSAVARVLNSFTPTQELGVAGERRCLWSSPAGKVECKIGQKLYPIWTANL